MERKIRPSLIEKEKIQSNVDLQAKLQKERAEKRLPAFFAIAKKTEDRDIKQLSQSLKKLYDPETGYFYSKDSLDSLGDTLFHRGITVLLDHAVSQLWDGKIFELKKNLNPSSETMTLLNNLVDKLPVTFSELSDKKEKVLRVHEFFENLDPTDASLLELSPDGKLKLQSEIEKIAGSTVDELEKSRDERKKSRQETPEELFEKVGYTKRLGTIVIPLILRGTIKEDIDPVYQNQRWKRRLEVLSETDISTHDDFRRFLSLFQDSWKIYENDPYILQAFNVYFNKISEKWMKEKLGKIIENPSKAQEHAIDALSRSITHLGRSRKLLRRLYAYLINKKPVEGTEAEEFLAGIDHIVTSHKYKSKSGQEVYFGPLSTLVHGYRKERHIQTGEIDPNELEERIKKYKPADMSKKSLKKMINDVTSDPELSIPEIEYVISSLLEVPLNQDRRGLAKFLNSKIRKLEHQEELISKVSKKASGAYLSTLDLLGDIWDTQGCINCPHRFPHTREKTAEQILREFGDVQGRFSHVCDVVQAGARGNKYVKPFCFGFLPDVQETMSEILGRPFDPDSIDDMKILNDFMYYGNNVILNLDNLDKNIDFIDEEGFSAKSMIPVDSLDIPEDSPAYPLLSRTFSPLFRHLKRVFDKRLSGEE
jgi:hypothetical protein